MIYLENNNGTQQIFIPKNLNISINKTYDEGFQDGMEYQKGKLTDLNVTENGVYTSENGYKQVNVEVPLDSEPCNLGELEYYVDSDYNVINALPKGFDGFHTVKIDATEYANSKYQNGKTEGYNEGYNQGYSEGINAGGGTSCNLMAINENISSVASDGIIGYNCVDYGVDGFREVFLNINELLESKYQEGVESVVKPSDLRFKAITVKCKDAGYIDVDRYYNTDKINSKSILILEEYSMYNNNYFHIYVTSHLFSYIIGSDIFGYKDEVYEVEMRNIEKIESNAMSNLTNLSKIVIKDISIVPDLIIESDAFANCTNLNLIEFDVQVANLTKINIDENAFRGCPENGTIRLRSEFDTNLLPYPLSNWTVEIIDNE